MSSIDQRIVEMQFNNKQFEEGIQTSMRSLSQFEKGLQLKGATNGLGEIDRAAKSFSFSGLADSVDFIASKFTGLGVMGVTAMQNIANSVYHTGERMVKSLTVEPIMAGFSEYETQINSIQTILANTQKEGTTLNDVTGALDELNAYADKTIYNFTEMTRNIGTFTAAGVKLDTATNAIQGIANLAAISGSTSQQASTAMYQLSQAMASGTVKLMDWNSVVNAGMGGQVFQDALKETAKAHGVAIDDMIKKHGSFRETLQEGWITTDVLTETLEKFTASTEGLSEEQIKANREMWKARGYTDAQIEAIFEMGKTATDAATKVKTFTQLFDTLKEAAQSGWTQSWEILVGDFDEAKELLTAISDEMGGIINASAKLRNDLLQGWKDAGGRDDVIEGLKNMYNVLKALIEPARQAFEEMFPPITIKQLKSFTQGFEDFTKKLKVTPNMADKLKRTFKGFFAILDIGAQALSTLGSGFTKLVGHALPVGSNLLDMTASLGDFLVELSKTTRESGIFGAAMSKIGDAIKFIAGKFEQLTGEGARVFKFFESIDLSGIELKIEPLKNLATVGSWAMGKLQAAYVKALPFLTTFGSYVASAFSGASSAVAGFVKDGTMSELAEGGMFAALILGITKITKAFESIGENVGGILDNLAGIFEGVTGALEGMQNKLNAEALKSIATAIAILAASLIALSLVNPSNINTSLTAMTAMFVELIAALGAVIKITSGSQMAKVMVAAKAMKTVSTAILMLAASMALIGNLDVDNMTAALIATVALMGALTVVTQKLSSGNAQMMKGAGSLIAFSVAIGILAASVKVLGSMDIGQLMAGLAGLGAVLLELAGFLAISNFSSIGISAGAGLMAVASAVLILSAAIRVLGNMDTEALIQGLAAVALALAGLLLAANALPSNLISAGVGLMAIASSLVIVGAALHIMGSLGYEEMAKGLITMAASLTALVVAANLMKGSIGGATAILIMSTALVAMGAALKLIATMSVGEIIKSLLTLAATLAVIGGAAVLLAPLTPAILGLSAAVAAFSAAAALGGVALLALGAGLTALGAGITALVVGVVASITTIIGAIPVLAEQIGATIVAIAEAISAAAPAVSGAIGAVVQMIVDILVNGIVSLSGAVDTAAPAILKLTVMLGALGAVAAVLAPLTPAIIAVSGALTAFGIGCAAIAAGVTLLAGAFALLGASGLVVASALADIHGTISSMGDLSVKAVAANTKTFYTAGEQAAEAVIDGLKTKLSESGDAFSSSLSSSIQNGVSTTIPTFAAALTDLVTSGKTVLVNSGGQFQVIGTALITRMAVGVNYSRGTAVSAVSGVSSGMQAALSDSSSAFYNIGYNIVKGLANGINANRSTAVSAARSLALSVKNAAKTAVDVNSPSKDFEDIGMWIDMGLANGLTKFSKLATNAATNLGQSTIQPVMTMTDTMISDLSSMGSALKDTSAVASSLDSSITSEQHVTMKHTFDDLTVKGVNDNDEFVAVVNYSVEDMVTELMRKGIRR